MTGVKNWNEAVERAREGSPEELRVALDAGIPDALAAFEGALPQGDRDVRSLRGASGWAFELVHGGLATERTWARELFLDALGRDVAWARIAYHSWYQPMVERICRAIVYDPNDARDLAMDISMRFVARYTQNAKATFPGYLIRMARTLSLRHVARSCGVAPAGLAPELRPCTHDLPDVRLIEDETRDRLRACLDRLDESQRNLLFLRYHDRLTLQELGARQGRSHQAVDQEIRRLLKKISQWMEAANVTPGDRDEQPAPR